SINRVPSTGSSSTMKLWQVWLRPSKVISRGVRACCRFFSRDWISSWAVTSRGGWGLPTCSNNIDTGTSHWRWSQCGWRGGPATSLSGPAEWSPGAGAAGVDLTIVYVLAGFALISQQVQQTGVDVLAVANQSRIVQIAVFAALGGAEEGGMLLGQPRGLQAGDKGRQAHRSRFTELFPMGGQGLP